MSIRFKAGAVFTSLAATLVLTTGCEPTYEQLRSEGYREMNRGDLVAARGVFKAAIDKRPESADVLYSIGRIYQAFAEQALQNENPVGAMRNLDHALAYYDRAIEAYPGYEVALRGKNRAYELRGQSEKALAIAQWAATNAGPNARQHGFLAGELEQRGDLDNALLRYRQAIKMEPKNAKAHLELARFYLRNNRRQEAAESLQIAYNLDSSLPGVVTELKKLGYEPVSADRSLASAPEADEPDK